MNSTNLNNRVRIIVHRKPLLASSSAKYSTEPKHISVESRLKKLKQSIMNEFPNKNDFQWFCLKAKIAAQTITKPVFQQNLCYS